MRLRCLPELSLSSVTERVDRVTAAVGRRVEEKETSSDSVTRGWTRSPSQKTAPVVFFSKVSHRAFGEDVRSGNGEGWQKAEGTPDQSSESPNGWRSTRARKSYKRLSRHIAERSEEVPRKTPPPQKRFHAPNVKKEPRWGGSSSCARTGWGKGLRVPADTSSMFVVYREGCYWRARRRV